MLSLTAWPHLVCGADAPRLLSAHSLVLVLGSGGWGRRRGPPMACRPCEANCKLQLVHARHTLGCMLRAERTERRAPSAGAVVHAGVHAGARRAPSAQHQEWRQRPAEALCGTCRPAHDHAGGARGEEVTPAPSSPRPRGAGLAPELGALAAKRRKQRARAAVPNLGSALGAREQCVLPPGTRRQAGGRPMTTRCAAQIPPDPRRRCASRHGLGHGHHTALAPLAAALHPPPLPKPDAGCAGKAGHGARAYGSSSTRAPLTCASTLAGLGSAPIARGFTLLPAGKRSPRTEGQAEQQVSALAGGGA
jgi:hypothetical protein